MGTAAKIREGNLEEIDERIHQERGHKDPKDIDLEPIDSEDEDYESAPPDYNITTYPADFTLEVLHQKYARGEFIIPEFQRNFVWKQVQASKLIESFLVGLPVPAVFLYSERQSQKFLVLDGQQRLRSIFDFFNGCFGNAMQFRLRRLHQNSRFKDKTFENLYDEDKRRLENAVLRAFIVKQLEPDDNTSMYHIFERLNTGGTFLRNQEIRNCIYHGKFVDFLAEVNSLEIWRDILGSDRPDTRKKDMELLVRFFAMRDLSGYKKPMKDYLSKFMKKKQSVSSSALKDDRTVFENTCKTVIDSLGKKPFHGRSGLNSAVYDAVMVAFSGHLNAIPEDIKSRYSRLRKDEAFLKNSTSATTDEETISKRFHRAAEILFG